MAERELTRAERAGIRALVQSSCANYDREYGCLPLECPCYMLGKWWTGAYCRYFQNAVLPLDPALEASLMGLDLSEKQKLCPVCGAAFLPTTSQAYCSDVCRAAGRCEAERRRKRNKRRNKG